jgi:hypothetical protein
MPRLIAIEGHESQRRKLEELLSDLSKKGYASSRPLDALKYLQWAVRQRRGQFRESIETIYLGSASRIAKFRESGRPPLQRF